MTSPPSSDDLPSAADWSAHDWEKIIPRALLYAAYRIDPLWKHDPKSPYITGNSPEDLVNSAIEKTIRGKRIWNPDKGSLLYHICLVISSDVNHLKMGFQNRRFVPATHFPSDVIQSSCKLYDLTRHADDAANPEESCLNNADKALYDDFCHTHLEDAPQLRQLLDLIVCRGVDRPADIARTLGEDINTINARKRQLNRLLRRILQQTVRDASSDARMTRKGNHDDQPEVE